MGFFSENKPMSEDEKIEVYIHDSRNERKIIELKQDSLQNIPNNIRDVLEVWIYNRREETNYLFDLFSSSLFKKIYIKFEDTFKMNDFQENLSDSLLKNGNLELLSLDVVDVTEECPFPYTDINHFILNYSYTFQFPKNFKKKLFYKKLELDGSNCEQSSQFYTILDNIKGLELDIFDVLNIPLEDPTIHKFDFKRLNIDLSTSFQNVQAFINFIGMFYSLESLNIDVYHLFNDLTYEEESFKSITKKKLKEIKIKTSNFDYKLLSLFDYSETEIFEYKLEHDYKERYGFEFDISLILNLFKDNKILKYVSIEMDFSKSYFSLHKYLLEEEENIILDLSNTIEKMECKLDSFKEYGIKLLEFDLAKYPLESQSFINLALKLDLGYVTIKEMKGEIYLNLKNCDKMKSLTLEYLGVQTSEILKIPNKLKWLILEGASFEKSTFNQFLKFIQNHENLEELIIKFDYDFVDKDLFLYLGDYVSHNPKLKSLNLRVNGNKNLGNGNYFIDKLSQNTNMTSLYIEGFDLSNETVESFQDLYLYNNSLLYIHWNDENEEYDVEKFESLKLKITQRNNQNSLILKIKDRNQDSYFHFF